MRPLIISAAALAAAGCLYTNIRSPRSYRSATPVDVKPSPQDLVVTGEACNQTVLYLVAWGNGGYIGATAKAMEGQEGVLYDVKTDIKVRSFLVGLYTRVCTVVTGKVGKL